MPEIELHALDEELLSRLLDAAVKDADPVEVMPPLEGPAGWTSERRAAFVRFHRTRSLSSNPVETTYAIVVDGTVVGAARLARLDDAEHVVEAGIWLGRSHRGEGTGTVVIKKLAALARNAGARRLFASTTADNAPAQRLLAIIDADVTHTDCDVTAWIDLSA
ncbi:GNAT family N-acetyltransferase [Nonomuraea sp. NPDC059023]|uniref:GNAT family N-acetyltransferase n=1 Tax=unclassified Nonomuraea TaxID=2593643 RepID=UPI0036BDF815